MPLILAEYELFEEHVELILRFLVINSDPGLLGVDLTLFCNTMGNPNFEIPAYLPTSWAW
jgi:hypothetical protein